MLRPQVGSLCTRCGEDLGIEQFSSSNQHLEDEGLPQVCRPCETVPPAFEQAFAFSNYEGTMRRLIHLLKYEGMEPIARALGRRLTPQVLAIPRPDAAAGLLVIPVPLHRSKRRERGFNQAELLARAVIQAAKKQQPATVLQLVSEVLERRRATESQAGLSTHQRRRNLRGAFFVPEKCVPAITGRDLLLIDDIYTTGATARACSSVLKQAGAARVWVATVARAQRDGVAMWDGSTMHGESFVAGSELLPV